MYDFEHEVEVMEYMKVYGDSRLSKALAALYFATIRADARDGLIESYKDTFMLYEDRMAAEKN